MALGVRIVGRPCKPLLNLPNHIHLEFRRPLIVYFPHAISPNLLPRAFMFPKPIFHLVCKRRYVITLKEITSLARVYRLELGHLVGVIIVDEHRATEHHHMHRRKSHVSWRNAKVGIIYQFGIKALIITSTIELHIVLQMIFADQYFQVVSLRSIAHKGQVIFLVLLA